MGISLLIHGVPFWTGRSLRFARLCWFVAFRNGLSLARCFWYGGEGASAGGGAVKCAWKC